MPGGNKKRSTAGSGAGHRLYHLQRRKGIDCIKGSGRSTFYVQTRFAGGRLLYGFLRTGRAMDGLTTAEARTRLAKFGPNAMPDTSVHPLRMALEKFWAPVPWMLEAAIVLEMVLGKYVESAIIA